MEVLIDGVEYSPTPPKAEKQKILDVLELPIDSNEFPATIREYFFILMKDLWYRKERFDVTQFFGFGRPSQHLYKTLIQHNLIPGKIGKSRNIIEFDQKAADAYIQKLITAAFYPPKEK